MSNFQQAPPAPASPLQEGMKFCMHCGKQIPKASKFCLECGGQQQ